MSDPVTMSVLETYAEPSVLRFSEARLNIIPALVKAFAKMPEITRTNTADTGRYKYTYADLGTALAAVRPALAEHGLAVLQPVTVRERGIVTVETLLLHESGEWASVSIDMNGATDPHSLGSAITYGRRYSLLAVLGVATEDDDGDKAQQQRKDDIDADEQERREAVNLFDRIKALGDRAPMFKAYVNETAPADHPAITINAMHMDRTWRLSVLSMFEDFTSAPDAESDRAEAPAPAEPSPADLPEGVTAGVLAMPATVRERIDQLPAGEKAALRDWARDRGIKNMLMPKADEVDTLVEWLDEYDAQTVADDQYAEVAQGEVDDHQA